MTKEEKLNLWRGRYQRDRNRWADERRRMDERELLYAGKGKLKPLAGSDKRTKGQEPEYIHNIILELIESEVSASIPQPKVTARREQDEELARTIENMLRNELDRLPTELLNDAQERTCPIQGGTFWLLDWDDSAGEGGEVSLQAEHPKRVIPQDGITSGMDEMDWIFLELPKSKREIRERYGVELPDMTEELPEVRDPEDASAAEDLVTQIVAVYRNDRGGVGRFSWVGNTVLEDLEDYYARLLPVCSSCGQIRPRSLGEDAACPNCGAMDWKMEELEFEELTQPIETKHGTVIGAELSPEATSAAMEAGDPLPSVKIPFYKPKKFPVILQRNVPRYGKLLGVSDVDAIESQQNALLHLDRKIMDRLFKAGTRITLPPVGRYKLDSQDQEIWHLDSPADAQMIGVYDFKGDLEYELYERSQIVQQARDTLGITQSFQGQTDDTAVSGVAKQFAAAQTAGRLESRRVCKDAAWAEIFEGIFQQRLAYADEPRPVVYQDDRGGTVYDEFNRYDFLERGADGEWKWNDDFLFSTDASSGLAVNRQAMWQELTASYQAGTFGQQGTTEALMLYWRKMEAQHYPGAAETAQYFREKLDREQEAARMQQMAAAAMQTAPAPGAQGAGGGLSGLAPEAGSGFPGGSGMMPEI